MHAGLYHPPGALKTTLCHRGRRLLYELCAAHSIPHRRVGKWLVAQDAAQADALAQMHQRTQAYAEGAVPTRWLSREERDRREPDVRADAAALESPESGIVDVHALMDWLEGRFHELGGDVAYGADVRGLEALPGGGFRIHTGTPADVAGNAPPGDADEAAGTITTETVVNSAGLAAIRVANMLLPAGRQVTERFARGTYFAYAAPAPRPGLLVYPAPQPGLGGLGTHLTLDLGEPPRVRFGPDVEWVDYDPVRDVVLGKDGREEAPYVPNRDRMAAALVEIKKYLPGLRDEALDVDLCGIRPKIGVDPGGEKKHDGDFEDFVIRSEEGFGGGFINMMGIESPGLTSSLAIAERVEQLLYG